MILMTSSTRRAEQLEKYLIRAVNNIIYRKMNDPRINFVTITRVWASSDLRYAKIYVSIYGDENHNENCLKALQGATKFIRGEIGKELKIRFVPEIKFLIDENMEYQYRASNIIEEMQQRERLNKGENEK